MKKSDRIKKEAEDTLNKIRALTRHIRNVEDNCFLLGEELIKRGEIDLGRQLIANGYVHDSSKFFGIEFDYLAYSTSANEKEAKLKQKLAIQNHRCLNKHHPESFSGGIKDMPDVFLAEFCCDCKSRSEEFGTDFRNWIDNEATKRFGFTKEDDVYKNIMKFVDILCPKPFEQITK